MAARGFDNDEIERTCLRASELARKIKEPIFLFAVLNALWGFHFTRGHVVETTRIAEELMAVAEQLNDPGSIKDAHSAIGAALDYTGDLFGAAPLSQPPGRSTRRERWADGSDLVRIPMWCLTAFAGVLYELGYPDQALKRAYEAMAAVSLELDGSAWRWRWFSRCRYIAFAARPPKARSWRGHYLV